MSPRRAVAIGECMIEMGPLEGGRRRQGFAGDTFNAAVHLRAGLGEDWTVGYVSAVGDDPMSDAMLAAMAARGIATEGVRRISGRRPGLYVIDLEDGERVFTYWRSESAARGLCAQPEVVRAALSGVAAIHLSGITLAILPAADRAALLDLVAEAKAAGAVVAFDPNLRPALWPSVSAMRDGVLAGLSVCDLALVTAPDDVVLFGDADAEALAARLHGLGVREVVVRAGAHPALVSSDGMMAWVPAAPAEVVDTSGAGDSFSGTYLAARLEGQSPEAAAQAAHRVAAQVIGRFGAI
ncbi:MAG: sugar kinase [Pseudomonadota bacterium]